MSRTELEHKDDEATIPFSDSLHFSDHPVPRRLTSSQKRANQWRRWSDDIIPRMIVPYLSYIEETLSLRHANVPGERHSNDGECGTGCRTRSIKVACILFNTFEEITIIACPCFPAPLQLLRRGLFPCAPMVPSLAVDLRVLEFVRLLFVRQSPNQTAWCDALETFLDGMRYKLTSKNSLRHRFSNAFHWYRVLTVLARDHISTLITDARKDSSRVDQPSEYLRSRCPLCFGGNDWRNEVRGSPSMPNIIVCIDACFTQKRSTNPRGATGSDPPNPTSSFFLPTADVNAMEDFVQRCRGEGRQARASRAEPDEDCYEEGMRVPVSVLNGCGDSFIAADEKREKASTRFFTDTGLMALLCRHDRVLWVANLTSVGEKQHYALALLDQLFKHLPAQMTIGLLYDIGCQLERSCHKWKFMDDNTLSRIAFAIAIFHAYGHQWPCQIVYHPRKREGFGLSDGEGCERLWSFLKPLIPSLRVSGFNQRLFVLDTQIRHLDSKSLQGFGHWLHRRWIHCQTKKNGALDSLHDLQVDEDMLRVEWKAQVDHQTRPAPRQSRNKAAEVITTVLALEKTLEAQEASIRELEMQLHSGRVPDIVEFNLQLADIRSRRAKTADTLRRRRAALGTEDKVNLQKMKKDIYLTVRLNALAVKTHIRDRLRQRKFELERLERSYRATINAEHKLHANTQQSIKRQEPGILKLVSTYNGLCSQLRSLIRQRRAPPYAIMPHIIPRDGIFLLDVDDDIWQDVGLDDDTMAPPAWLSDDAVRNGIRLQLEVDRCVEEEARLMHERAVIQEWMLAEWGAIRGASNNAVTDAVMSFHLRSHADELVNICVVWKKKVQCIPCAWPVGESWGPSDEALLQAARDQAQSSFRDEDDAESVEGEEGDCEGDLEYGEIGDEELMDAIEDIALADEYRYDYSNELVDDTDDIDDHYMPSSPIKLSNKRRCI
ncbi:uncharacterized protein F5891DRAFT_954811 [Suillus fuscotomentosus]|uniref:CxC1-like cysteine cluster associated with KDZ transposases domain-containing protein n=1 Tax=Suillus fuscotomentosus TaxID=1912939 RepID=A0AAD4E3Z0_9AGAM|nr:uncharacterized protein F5891DRAFT_954811 [Suillus fuscotomentosus]KAG1898846.1 hypothetical protein F5891DRAFT_954811 [Suillus fuscotomentosus]